MIMIAAAIVAEPMVCRSRLLIPRLTAVALDACVLDIEFNLPRPMRYSHMFMVNVEFSPGNINCAAERR